MDDMAGKTYTEIVIKEIQDSVSSVDEGAFDSLTEKIELERRIFCDGAGRSRLQIAGGQDAAHHSLSLFHISGSV